MSSRSTISHMSLCQCSCSSRLSGESFCCCCFWRLDPGFDDLGLGVSGTEVFLPTWTPPVSPFPRWWSLCCLQDDRKTPQPPHWAWSQGFQCKSNTNGIPGRSHWYLKSDWTSSWGRPSFQAGIRISAFHCFLPSGWSHCWCRWQTSSSSFSGIFLKEISWRSKQ